MKQAEGILYVNRKLNAETVRIPDKDTSHMLILSSLRSLCILINRHISCKPAPYPEFFLMFSNRMRPM